MSRNNYFKKYSVLRTAIDARAAELETLHRPHLLCKKGCDLCCMDYRIFPVEFYSIVEELKTKNLKMLPVENDNDGSCVFLQNHVCSIYNERPIICRTHGLPLLYANNDSEFELSACELNFTEFDFDDFTAENTLSQDTFNSRLFMLNKSFIRELDDKKFGEFDLIPLKNIADSLDKL